MITLTDINDCPSSVMPGGVNQQLVGYATYTEAMINVLTAEDTICHNSLTGSLEVLNPNVDPAYTYSWSTGDSILSIDNLSAGVYILYADYNNTDGCTTSDTLQVIELSEITNTVTIVDVDCYGENTGSITATAGGTITPYTYTWSTGQSGPVVSNLSEGNYSLTVIDGNDCEHVFPYTINQVPEIVIDIAINNTYILTASVLAGGTAPYTYQWSDANGIIPSATSSSYTVSSNGTYYVLVTDANDCNLTSDVISYETTAVIESDLLALNIYPNPFNKETTVDFGRTIKQAVIRVVDVYGKLIEEYNITNTNKHMITRNNKASGIYFMEIEVGDVQIFNKLVIE